MNKYYNPEYYGAPETPNIERDLYEGEMDIVENILNEGKNREAIIEADESIFQPIVVDAPRDLYPEELNVVSNLENYKKIKEDIIESPIEDKETVDEEVYHSEY